MAQEFSVLGREMFHHLLNVMIGVHGRAEALISLEFQFSSEHILTDQNDWQENQLLKRLRSPGNDRVEMARATEAQSREPLQPVHVVVNYSWDFLHPHLPTSAPGS